MKQIGRNLGIAVAALTAAAVATWLMAQEAPAPPEGLAVQAPDVAQPVPADAVTTAIVTLGTYLVRRFLVARHGEDWLKGKPKILGWVSAGLALAAGSATDLLFGAGTVAGMAGGGLRGWVLAQALRRVKKLANVA